MSARFKSVFICVDPWLRIQMIRSSSFGIAQRSASLPEKIPPAFSREFVPIRGSTDLIRVSISLHRRQELSW